MSRDDARAHRTVELRLPPRVWRAIEKSATENYRFVNAEIAVRIIESLPQEERE